MYFLLDNKSRAKCHINHKLPKDPFQTGFKIHITKLALEDALFTRICTYLTLSRVTSTSPRVKTTDLHTIDPINLGAVSGFEGIVDGKDDDQGISSTRTKVSVDDSEVVIFIILMPLLFELKERHPVVDEILERPDRTHRVRVVRVSKGHLSLPAREHPLTIKIFDGQELTTRLAEDVVTDDSRLRGGV